MGGTDGNERKGIKIGINRCDSGNHDAETYYSTQRTSAERKEVCINGKNSKNSKNSERER